VSGHEPWNPPVRSGLVPPRFADSEAAPRLKRRRLFRSNRRSVWLLCDDPVPAPMVRKISRQHSGPDLGRFRWDSGTNAARSSITAARKGIKTIAIMGISTTCCVLSRSFGIANWSALDSRWPWCVNMTDESNVRPAFPPPTASTPAGTELVVKNSKPTGARP